MLTLRREATLVKLASRHTPQHRGSLFSNDGKSVCFIGAIMKEEGGGGISDMVIAKHGNSVIHLNDRCGLTIAEIAEMVLAQPEKYGL